MRDCWFYLGVKHVNILSDQKNGYKHCRVTCRTLFFAGFLPRYDISHISYVHLARWQLPSGKFFLTSFPIINMLYDVRNDPELVVLRPSACRSCLFFMTIKMQNRIMPPKQEYSARRGIAARFLSLPWRPPTPRTPRGRPSPSNM